MDNVMRYYVIRNYELVGPFSAAEVVRLLDFDADSLVCPAGEDGRQMGDWERAVEIPELAGLLRAAAGLPKERGYLPPDPTIEDLDTLRDLHGKVKRLTTSYHGIQDTLETEGDAIASMKSGLDSVAKHEAGLDAKLGDILQRLERLEGMRRDLDAMRELDKARVEMMEDLRRELQRAQVAAKEMGELARSVEAAQQRLEAKLPPPPPESFPAQEQGPRADAVAPPAHALSAPHIPEPVLAAAYEAPILPPPEAGVPFPPVVEGKKPGFWKLPLIRAGAIVAVPVCGLLLYLTMHDFRSVRKPVSSTAPPVSAILDERTLAAPSPEPSARPPRTLKAKSSDQTALEALGSLLAPSPGRAPEDPSAGSNVGAPAEPRIETTAGDPQADKPAGRRKRSLRGASSKTPPPTLSSDPRDKAIDLVRRFISGRPGLTDGHPIRRSVKKAGKDRYLVKVRLGENKVAGFEVDLAAEKVRALEPAPKAAAGLPPAEKKPVEIGELPGLGKK